MCVYNSFYRTPSASAVMNKPIEVKNSHVDERPMSNGMPPSEYKVLCLHVLLCVCARVCVDVLRCVYVCLSVCLCICFSV